MGRPMFALLLFISSLVGSLTAFELTIALTESIRGRVLPLDGWGSECDFQEYLADPAGSGCVGGAARRQTYLKETRQWNPNLLVVDAGSIFFWSSWTSAFEGVLQAKVTNMLGYDVVRVTTDYFSNQSPHIMKNYVEGLTSATILGTNVGVEAYPHVQNAVNDPWVQPWYMKTMNGQKVGVVGMLDPRFHDLSLYGSELELNPLGGASIDSARLAIFELHATHPDCNIIVYISAYPDVEYDYLFNTLLEVDIFYVIEKDVGHDWNAPTATFKRANAAGEPVLVVVPQLPQYGGQISELNATFSAEGLLEAYSTTNVVLDSRFQDDPEVMTILEEHDVLAAVKREEVMGSIMLTIFGESGGPDNPNGCRWGDCAIGRVLGAAMLEVCTDCDLSFMNGGGIRSSLMANTVERIDPVTGASTHVPILTNITRGQVTQVNPFQNSVSTLRMKGDKLLLVLRKVATNVGEGSFLQSGGLRLSVNAQAQLLLSANVWDPVTLQWEPVDEDRVYKVAVNNYLGDGGDGYSEFPDYGTDVVTDVIELVEALARYLSNHSPMQPPHAVGVEVTNECNTNAVLPLTAQDCPLVFSDLTSYTAPPPALYLGLLPPSTPSSSNFGAALLQATQFMVDEVNAGELVLPNTELRVAWAPHNGSVATAIESALRLSDFRCLVVLGPEAGETGLKIAKALSPNTDRLGLPLLSYGVTSSVMSDELLYPNFVRTAPLQGALAGGVADTLAHFGWTDVGLLFSNDEAGSGFTSAFSQRCGQLGVTVQQTLLLEGRDEAARSALHQLLSSGLRVFVADLNSDDAVFFFQLLQSSPEYMLRGFVHLWARAPSDLLYPAMQPLDDPAAAAALNTPGLLGVVAPVGRGSEWDTLWEAARTSPSNAVDLSSLTLSQRQQVAYVADAVALVASSAHSLIEAEADVRNDRLLVNRLKSSTVAGLSGAVGLDDTGDRKPMLLLLNWQEQDGLVVVGDWASSRTAPGTGVQLHTAPIWPGGGVEIPSGSMLEADQLTCLDQACGSHASCGDSGVWCVCDSGYEKSQDLINQQLEGSLVQPADYSCVLRLASSGEQRVFWTLALAFSIASAYKIAQVMVEYRFNPATRTPVSMSYLALVVPDFILSFVYLPFHFTNLLRGEEVDEGSCKVIAFITYGVVIATFAGPPVVAYVSLKHFQKVVAMDRSTSPPVSNKKMAVLLMLPWLMGLLLASAVLAKDKLGSFRGLYCYASDSTHFLTGGMTMGLMVLSSVVSSVLYVRVALVVKQAGMTSGAHLMVLKRGAKLIACMFLTWLMFCVAGFMNLVGQPPPVWLESVGALLVTLQPLIDSHMILNTPNIRKESLKRKLRHNKGRVLNGGAREDSSSVASSASTYGGRGGNKVLVKTSSVGPSSKKAGDYKVAPEE